MINMLLETSCTNIDQVLISKDGKKIYFSYKSSVFVKDIIDGSEELLPLTIKKKGLLYLSESELFFKNTKGYFTFSFQTRKKKSVHVPFEGKEALTSDYLESHGIRVTILESGSSFSIEKSFPGLIVCKVTDKICHPINPPISVRYGSKIESYHNNASISRKSRNRKIVEISTRYTNYFKIHDFISKHTSHIAQLKSGHVYISCTETTIYSIYTEKKYEMDCKITCLATLCDILCIGTIDGIYVLYNNAIIKVYSITGGILFICDTFFECKKKVYKFNPIVFDKNKEKKENENIDFTKNDRFEIIQSLKISPILKSIKHVRTSDKGCLSFRNKQYQIITDFENIEVKDDERILMVTSNDNEMKVQVNGILIKNMKRKMDIVNNNGLSYITIERIYEKCMVQEEKLNPLSNVTLQTSSLKTIYSDKGYKDLFQLHGLYYFLDEILGNNHVIEDRVT